MGNTARALMGDSDWWRRASDDTHHRLTEAAHELSDEAARTIEYLALLCGVLARDAGWDEDAAALAASVRERVKYDYGIMTDHMNLAFRRARYTQPPHVRVARPTRS